MEKLLLSPCRHSNVVRKAVEHVSMALPYISTERSKQLSLFQTSAVSQGVPVPTYASVLLVEAAGAAWASLYPGSRHPKYKMRNNRWLQTDGRT